MEPTRIPSKLAQLLPRGGLAALTEGIEFISLWRWIKLSVGVGLVVGLAAVAVAWILAEGSDLLLNRLGGLAQPVPELRARWWIVLLLPAAGGLVVGLIIWRWAPEVAGAGVDPVIDAYHNQRGRIRRRVPGAKLIATVFTLGTGGSAGREGPMAQIGAGFGSFLATQLNLSARERRLLLLAGAAGGISALFRAPLGAALWSLEVLYKDDFESEGLFPCLVSSVTSYSVFTAVHGPGSLFSVLDASGLPVSFQFDPLQLLFFAALGLACGPLGALWIKWLEITRGVWAALPIPIWSRPALGGLLLGALCIAVPWVFGSGYGWLQDALRGGDDPARLLPLGYTGAALLAAIAFAKMLATSLTVSSGGSGGVFAPSLFIGGFIGGAFGLTLHELFPGVVTNPSAFVLVGMGAFYAGISRTPIATIILISEMFGSYDLLVPLMLAQMISTLLLRRFSLYKAQVETARQSPVHAAEYVVDVLAEMKVSDIYTHGRGAETIEARMSIRDFLDKVTRTADAFFIVRRNSDNKLVGIVSLSNIRSVVTEGEFLDAIVVGDAMWPVICVTPDLTLAECLDVFLESGYGHLVVVARDDPDTVLGMISHQQILETYNAEIVRRQLDSEDATVPPG